MNNADPSPLLRITPRLIIRADTIVRIELRQEPRREKECWLWLSDCPVPFIVAGELFEALAAKTVTETL